MIPLYFDGFENYADGAQMTRTGWTGTSFNISTSIVRSGARALSTSNGAANTQTRIAPPLPSTPAQGMALMAFRVDDGVNGPIYQAHPVGNLIIYDGATVQLAVVLNPDGSISVKRGAAILGTSAPGKWVKTAYYRLDFGFVIDPAAGSYDARIDGVSVLSATGVNTRESANSRFTLVGLGGMCTTSGGTSVATYFDDLAIYDTNAFVEDRKIEALRPDGDVLTGWTRSAGTTNFSAVNKATYAATPNVSTVVPGTQDLYDIGPLATAPGAVDAVAVCWHASKSDAGAANARAWIKSGAVTAFGTTRAMVQTGAGFREIFPTDPATGLAWTQAGIAAMQIGVELVS